ncbi:hypothetical protein FQK02_12850 [Xanthomonas vasicola]|nr:hypothetical protein NX80_011370 [Xanthomonas vasicola pv. arecae]AZR34700.1 hypothetical protein NX08_009655 [Xanthomonas vasicola]TWQ09543.1 hypothetical protein FQK02_12850 [Xanthomonas vasicola]
MGDGDVLSAVPNTIDSCNQTTRCDMGSDTDHAQLAVVWRIIGDPCLFAMLASALQCCKAPPTPMPRKRSLALASVAATN